MTKWKEELNPQSQSIMSQEILTQNDNCNMCNSEVCVMDFIDEKIIGAAILLNNF